MRKILLGLIVILLLGFSVYAVVYGIELGKIQIDGIPAIQEEDAILNEKIIDASTLKNTDYPRAYNALESAYKSLMNEKESYEELVSLGVDENGQPLNQMPVYEIEKIWIIMGNYADKEGVDIKMDITVNNTITNTYDLNFTVEGGYIQITDFLYNIERDTTLVFKLENFRMVPTSTTDVLSATFTCKDVKLNIKAEQSTTKPSTTDTTNTNTNTNTDTTTNTDNNQSVDTTDTNTTDTTNTNTTNTSRTTDTIDNNMTDDTVDNGENSVTAE